MTTKALARIKKLKQQLKQLPPAERQAELRRLEVGQLLGEDGPVSMARVIQASAVRVMQAPICLSKAQAERLHQRQEATLRQQQFVADQQALEAKVLSLVSASEPRGQTRIVCSLSKQDLQMLSENPKWLPKCSAALSDTETLAIVSEDPAQLAPPESVELWIVDLSSTLIPTSELDSDFLRLSRTDLLNTSSLPAL